jgi:uncharacterized SAM-binding protein YcdF (DUF218 family)
MFSIALLVLSLCWLWLWRFRQAWPRSSLMATVLLGALFMATAGGFLPRVLLNALQQPYRVMPLIEGAPSTVFVLLTGGSVPVPGTEQTLPTVLSYSRLVKTVQLYQACSAHQSTCTILVSGGDPKRLGVSEADTYQSQLLALGVPAKNVKCESTSDNTYQEAQHVKLWLASHPYDQVVLVTSAFHMQRSVQNFQRIHLSVIPVASDYLAVPPRGFAVGYNLMLMDIAVHEYVGMIALFLSDHV